MYNYVTNDKYLVLTIPAKDFLHTDAIYQVNSALYPPRVA